VKTIAVYNIKGGVGKTASAVNLAFLATMQGRRTLVWDLDPQGAATFYFRVRPKIEGGSRALLKKKARSRLPKQIRGTDLEGLDLLPADFSFRKLDLTLDEAKRPEKPFERVLGVLATEYDLLFLDCAPSISVASEAVFEVADVLLVPTIPTPLSLRTLEQLNDHLAKGGPKNLRVLPFLSMVDRRKQIHRRVPPQLLALCEEMERVETPLRTPIPYSSYVEQMGIHRAPLFSFAHRSPPAKAYATLWREICQRLEI
jgi:cellulose biosynthesis protein BcsQ